MSRPDTSVPPAATPPQLRLVVSEHLRSVDELLVEAERAEKQGQRAEARELYELALRQLRGPAAGSRAAAILCGVGRTHQLDADLDAARDCLDAAIAVAEACGDDAALGHAIHIQAMGCWRGGDLGEAERLYSEARQVALRAGDDKLAATASASLGVVASIRGDLPEAQRHYETSLATYRALGLATDVAVTLNNLGKLFTETRRWVEAQQAYYEAVGITTILGDLASRVGIEVNLAELWIAQGSFDQALAACGRAEELLRAIGDDQARGMVSKTRGVIARETGEHALAERHFADAARHAEQRQDLLVAAETAREAAELFRRQGRNRDMLQNLNRAHALFSTLRARREVADIDHRAARLEGEFLDVVRRWSESIEAKDRFTQGHCQRVADLACALAARAGLEAGELFWFRVGALLHDIGKLIIPAEVLNKPGKLDAEEWELVRRHPLAGVELLSDVEFPWDILSIVRSHHERWDGRGYPDGLAGEAIPVTARILAIADAYDALSSRRAYKAALEHAEVMTRLRRDVGTQFDPDLFALFEQQVSETQPGRARRRSDKVPEATDGASPASPDEAPAEEAAPVRAAPPLWVTELPRPVPTRVDDLTGTLLRTDFLRIGEEVLRRAQEGAHACALIVIDVDHFKLVNDTYGHLQGDDVLRAVAEALRSELRATDYLGRYAGDEFVVLLPAMPLATARTVADRLRARVEQLRVPRRDATGAVGVSLSIGISASPTDGGTMEELFAAADKALYVVKRRGRNAVATTEELTGGESSPQVVVERFVGRAEEHDRLVRMLDAVERGEPAMLAVIGPAGAGKSTLLRQLAPDIGLRSGLLLQGRAHEADVRPPYGPWADILTALHETGLVPARAWRELPRLVPALGAVSGETQGKYALLEEISEYLRLAAAQRMLVLVLDDVQWADEGSWETLEYLVDQLTTEPVLIALTLRAEDATQDITERLRRCSRDTRFTEMRLARLEHGEVRYWVESVFGEQALCGELADYLFDRGDGNPLITTHLLRTLLDEGAVAFTEGRWQWTRGAEPAMPATVRDLLMRRLERLTPAARHVLTTAAVIGRIFDIGIVIAASGDDEVEVLAAIDEGTGAAVIEPVAGTGGKRYTFAHGMLVRAILETTTEGRRRWIHSLVAEALIMRSPDALAEIAVHSDEAGDGARAHEYAMRAGVRASSVHAHEQASAFFGMAERHAPSEAARSEARLRHAAVAEIAGRYDEAERLCELVLADVAPGDAARRIPVLRMRERLRVHRGQSPVETLATARELVSAAEAAGLVTEQVMLLTMVSLAHSRLAEWDEAERIARRCVEMASGTGDLIVLADAIARLGSTMLDLRPHDAIEEYGKALALYLQLDDRIGQMRCHINAGIAQLKAGNGQAAEAALLQAIELGRSTHTPDLLGLALLNLGVHYLWTGHDRTDVTIEEALRAFNAVRNEPHRLAALYNLAHATRQRGDIARANAYYAECVELAERIGYQDLRLGAIAGTGLCALDQHDLARAAAASRAIDERLVDRGGWYFQGRELAEALAIRLAATRGEVDDAERRFDAALALLEPHSFHDSAWLVAECAAVLATACRPAYLVAIQRVLPKVRALGYTPLERRFADTMPKSERAITTA